MALFEMHLGYQAAVGRMISVNAIVPDNCPGPWATLYLLHGLSDDQTAWARRTSVERYVDGLPLLVVMPTTDRGWYVDSASVPNANFGTFIARDLVAFVDRTFPTNASRAGRAVAGLSMGGYGALRFALGSPETFAAAVSHSGATNITREAYDVSTDRGRELASLFGVNPADGPNDLYALAKSVSVAERPALRIDCGVDDFLIEHNREFHAYLDGFGYAHEYAEHPGAHDWAYWDLHIQDTIAFVSRELGISKA